MATRRRRIRIRKKKKVRRIKKRKKLILVRKLPKTERICNLRAKALNKRSRKRVRVKRRNRMMFGMIL